MLGDQVRESESRRLAASPSPLSLASSIARQHALHKATDDANGKFM
jgi:hypothetical protein